MLQREKGKKIFTSLYENVNGRALSLKGREEKQYKSKSFVYGEVLPDPFFELISETNPQPGYNFYDMGSGTGKAVMLCHLLFDFKKCTGIEFIDTLSEASREVAQRYEKDFRPELSEEEVDDRQIKFIQGNFLEQDVSDADVIWMNSTCFQDDLMGALEFKLECLKPYAQVVSLSKSLRSPAFHQYKHKMFEFSWGQATAFYHRRRLWNVYS